MIRNFVEYDTIRQSCLYRPLLNPFKTAVPLWGQTNQISSSLSPKRDWSPKRVNTWYVRFDQIEVSNNHIYTYHRALFTFVIKKRIVNTRTRACNWFLTLEIRIRTQKYMLAPPLALASRIFQYHYNNINTINCLYECVRYYYGGP